MKKPRPRKRRSVERIGPAEDAAETVERLISRRQLVVEDGDVLIVRAQGGLVSARRPLYELRIYGHSMRVERFATFEHAAAHGEEIATRQHVRLFYADNDDDRPHLLKDARRS